MNDEIIKAINKELTICYIALGRKVPEEISLVSITISESVPFSSVDNVHEIFTKAKDIESIPTQKTLKECWKNYGEEWLKYHGEINDAKAIGYEDPLSAWIPKSEVARRVNQQEAIKNYCIAHSNEMYNEYVRCHITITKDNLVFGEKKKSVEWLYPDKVYAFEKPIKDYLLYIYGKYLRIMKQYVGYPADAEISLSIQPPSVTQFKTILERETNGKQQ